MEWFRMKTVGEISSFSKGFRPEGSRGMRFDEEGLGDFKQSAILAFCNPILLWSVRTRGLVDHSIVRNEKLYD